MLAPRIKQRIDGLPRTMAEVNRSLQHLASLRALGWHESLHRRTAVDANGEPLPWYTYPCIEWLATRLQPTDAVFEFGAGSSTLWYARKVEQVVSVEHDDTWFSRVAAASPPNAQAHLCNSDHDEVGELVPDQALSSYAGSIKRYPLNSFDVVAVDGLERMTCTWAALPHLKDDGLLILDNSDRQAYRPALEYLADQGFGRIDFFGFWPAAGFPGCTSVFARSFDRWVTTGRVPMNRDLYWR
jgi:predicted O-methyltransferase YrrM